MSNRWHVPANRERSYEIRVSEPLLDDGNGALVEGGGVPGRRFVVLDRGVCPQWQARLRLYFEARDVRSEFMVVPGGERCKTMETVSAIVSELRQYGLDRRNEPIIVIGGRAVLDTASFAASVYRRGVPFVRVPTTVFGYVDASVGIKTAVNLGGERNLIGTFSAPALVLLDREFFGTLPPREIANGLGEVLKLGMGFDPELFEWLDAGAADFATTQLRDASGFAILHRSIDVTLDRLRHNIFERDPCPMLELGHTFAPVFEASGDGDSVRHGEAVAFDLNLSAIISAGRGLLDADSLRRLADLTERLGLPTTVPDVAPQALWDCLLDRNRYRAGRQRIPLPRQIGECAFVADLTRDEVFVAFDELRRTHFRAVGAVRSVGG
jgi:2-epi-5-epi-valiolone synthase